MISKMLTLVILMVITTLLMIFRLAALMTLMLVPFEGRSVNVSEYCYIKSIPPKHVLPQIRGLGSHTTFLIL